MNKMGFFTTVAKLNNSAIKMIQEQKNYVDGINLFKKALDNCFVHAETRHVDHHQDKMTTNSISTTTTKNNGGLPSCHNNFGASDDQRLFHDGVAESNASHEIILEEIKFFDDFVLLSTQQITKCHQEECSIMKHEAISAVILYNLGLLLRKTNQANESHTTFKLVLELLNGSPKLKEVYPSIVVATLYQVGEATLTTASSSSSSSTTTNFEDSMVLFIDAIQFGLKHIRYTYIYVSICSKIAGILMQYGYVDDAEALYKITDVTYNIIGSSPTRATRASTSTVSNEANSRSSSAQHCNLIEEEHEVAPAA